MVSSNVAKWVSLLLPVLMSVLFLQNDKQLRGHRGPTEDLLGQQLFQVQLMHHREKLAGP